MTKRFNWLILVLILALSIFSLALIFSLAPHLIVSQLIYILLGLVIFFLFSRLDYEIFRHFHWFLFIFVILFLASTFVFGRLTRGTLRWIKIGPLTFQPSELVKPVLILTFASFVSLKDWNFKRLISGLILLLIPAYLIFQQPDLGSTLVVGLIWLAIFSLRLDKKQTVFLSVFFLAGLLAAGFFLRTYQKERLSSFLDPFEDPLGRGYHLIQATIAAGSGKFFGRGLLRGTQSHLEFLPERHSDFIFASLAEELGFFGSTIVILTYFLLLAQILKTAKEAQDNFGTFICVGVFALFAAQFFINVGMNLGMLPITGITLPLISSGGSSVVTSMISLGLTESVFRKIRAKGSIEIK
jgi:rod shape determining protein RodA